jgi:hypothetical protein
MNMRREKVNDLLQALHEAEDAINETKGEGYANDQDALANFKRAAQHLGLSPLQICGVYMSKHFDAIMSYAKHGDDITGENLMGRVVDLRLYAALFLALAREDTIEEEISL